MKIAIMNEDEFVTLTLSDDKVKAITSNETVKQAFLNGINSQCDTKFEPSDTKIIDLTGKHLCKYCGEVVDGEYEDLLCADCRYTFGHALYSEL
jgi:hypothetical protein